MEIPYIQKDAVRSRFVDIGQMFDIFCEDFKKKVPDVEIEIDSKKLRVAVYSYFIDVSRYKWWHFPEDPASALIDGAKKAAFTAFWLNKLSPVYTRGTAIVPPLAEQAYGVPKDIRLAANIHFTVFVISIFLEFAFSDELLEKLLYHMLWREESAKHYMLLFEALSVSARGNALFLKTSA